MGYFLEIIYDVLFNPVAAMRQITDKKPVAGAFAAFLLSVGIPAAAVYFALKNEEWQKLFAIIFLAQLIGSFLMWFFGAAVLSLVAEVFGGRGSSFALFVALGFTNIPRILIVPILVVAAVLPGGVGAAVLAVASLAVIFWTMYLDVAAIMGSHGLSAVRALLVLIAPLIMVAAAVIILIAVVGASLVPGRF